MVKDPPPVVRNDVLDLCPDHVSNGFYFALDKASCYQPVCVLIKTLGLGASFSMCFCGLSYYTNIHVSPTSIFECRLVKKKNSPPIYPFSYIRL